MEIKTVETNNSDNLTSVYLEKGSQLAINSSEVSNEPSLKYDFPDKSTKLLGESDIDKFITKEIIIDNTSNNDTQGLLNEEQIKILKENTNIVLFIGKDNYVLVKEENDKKVFVNVGEALKYATLSFSGEWNIQDVELSKDIVLDITPYITDKQGRDGTIDIHISEEGHTLLKNFEFVKVYVDNMFIHFIKVYSTENGQYYFATPYVKQDQMIKYSFIFDGLDGQLQVISIPDSHKLPEITIDGETGILSMDDYTTIRNNSIVNVNFYGVMTYPCLVNKLPSGLLNGTIILVNINYIFTLDSTVWLINPSTREYRTITRELSQNLNIVDNQICVVSEDNALKKLGTGIDLITLKDALNIEQPPQATETTLGMVKAIEKSNEITPIAIDKETGMLYAPVGNTDGTWVDLGIEPLKPQLTAKELADLLLLFKNNKLVGVFLTKDVDKEYYKLSYSADQILYFSSIHGEINNEISISLTNGQITLIPHPIKLMRANTNPTIKEEYFSIEFQPNFEIVEASPGVKYIELTLEQAEIVAQAQDFIQSKGLDIISLGGIAEYGEGIAAATTSISCFVGAEPEFSTLIPFTVDSATCNFRCNFVLTKTIAQFHVSYPGSEVDDSLDATGLVLSFLQSGFRIGLKVTYLERN